MNIIIIEPYQYDKQYDIRSLTPALGPVIIASLLKQQGHKVQVISEYITKLNLNEINRADLVGISITTYNATRGYEIARHIKKTIVFGGFHASLMPEECLKYGDYVITGDGHSIVELVKFLNKSRKNDISEISNLVYSENSHIIYNKLESKVINIVPDFRLVKDYYKFNWNRLLRIPLLVNASRGCSYNCYFCAIVEIYKDFKKKNRRVLIEDIISQTDKQHFLSKFFPRGIWITDDNFFSDEEWAVGVLEKLAKLKSSYRFVIQARVDIAYNDKLLALMAKANVRRVYLGLESLREASLAEFQKRFCLKDIEYAVEKIRNYGMKVYGLFVFGNDEFEKGDGSKVAEFVRKYKLSGVLIQPLTPFPGTKLFKKLEKEARILHQDWEFYNGKVVFVPKNLTAAELQEEISNCYKKVYSPLQVIKWILFEKNEWKLGVFGEALFRNLEAVKMKNYAGDKLR